MNLEKLRMDRGLSQKELAEKAGVAAFSICRYESGKRVPDVDVAARIAAALDCTVDDLIKDTGAEQFVDLDKSS